MRIKKEEIRAAVAQFMRRATTYEVDQELGISDQEDSYRQMVEVVTTALITDPNVIYGLLRVGVSRVSERFSEVLTLINSIDELFPSLFNRSTPDPINNKEMAALDDSLFAAAISPTGESVESLQEAMKKTSQALGHSLPRSEGVNDTPIEARRKMQEHVTSLDERVKLLVADFSSLVRGLGTFNALDLSQSVLGKAVGAVENLFYDMRVERIEFDERKADIARRDRFIQMEAARSVLQVLNNLPDNEEYRIRTRISPNGRNIVFSARADEDRVLESISTKSGGYDIGSGDTMVVAVDGSAQTVAFPRTTDPTLLGKAAPSVPVTDKFLHILAGYKTLSLGPYAVAPSSLIYPHAEFTVPGGSPSFVGHYCTLRYTGTAPDETTAAMEGQLYKIVRYRKPSSSVIELDPPLPNTTVPAGWELTLQPLSGSWSVPAFTSPADLANKINRSSVANAPWRVHTKLTGTITGVFRPGERIYKSPLADKEGVVIYATGTDMWIHGCASEFAIGEEVRGRSSGAKMTAITAVVTTGVADKDLNAGQPNIARMVTASVYDTNKLRLEAKTLLAAGTKASITGASLTLTLAVGERGLWESGLWPDMVIYVDGAPYTIANITSNTQATLSTPAPAPVANKVWFATVKDQIDTISALISGDHLDPEELDITGLPGYDALAVFKKRTVPRVTGISAPADELEMQLPQTDTMETLSAAEVVAAIKAANVPGLNVEEYRETVYDSEGASLALVVGSKTITVTGDLTASLIGYYVIPTEGEHHGEDFLVEQDNVSPRTLVTRKAARVTETLTKFKVEARRIRLYTEPKGVDGELTFGNGTAHTKLGFPTLEAITAMVKSGVFTEEGAEVDISLLNVAEDDEIFIDPNYKLTIDTIDNGTVTFQEELPGSVQEVDVAVPGKCPEEWDRVSREATPIDQEWQEEEDPLGRLKNALGYITETNIRIQPEDVVPAKEAIAELQDRVNRSMAVLNSLDLPDVDQARNVLRMLEERGYDNVTRMLTLGKFDEFLDSGVNTATLAGKIQDNIKGALGFLGQSSTPDEIDEDESSFVLASDEPVELGDDMVGRKQFDLDDEEGDGVEIVESNEVYSGD